MKEDNESTAVLGAPQAGLKRISWGAVFAGLLVALVVQLLLGVIGLSVGAAAFDPQEAAPGQGFGVGSGIWFALSTIIALFAGGWVAGRLAGVPRRTDSVLHGLLTWSLATLATAYLLTTAVGGVISGATGIVGRGLSMLGSGAATLAPELIQQGREELAERGVGREDIKNELVAILRDTGKPELQAENLGAAGERAREDAAEAVKQPGDLEQEADTILGQLFKEGQQAVEAVDKEAVVNVLVQRTDMNRGEASRAVDAWAQRYESAQVQLSQMRENAEQRAREMGSVVADNVARAAGWSAFAMILGAVAAAFGGYFARPRDVATIGF